MSDFTTWRSLVDGEEIGVIPDSEVFHPIDEGSGTTWADANGDRDASFNSLEWIEDSDAFGGQKAKTDGVDGSGTISYDELGSELQDFALAFTVETTDEAVLFSYEGDDIGEGEQRFEIWTSGFYDTPTGRIGIVIRDDNSDDYSFYSDTDVTDGSRYRVFIRVIDASNHDAEIYVTEEGESFGADDANNERTESPSNFVDFEDDLRIAERFRGGDNIENEWDALAIYENDPGSDEAEDDFNAQPWS